jgi:hypothetical protein
MDGNTTLCYRLKEKKGSKIIPISPSNTMIYGGWYDLGVYREHLHILLQMMLILKKFLLHTCLLHINASCYSV